MEGDQILKLKDVMEITRRSRLSLDRDEAAGRFPLRVRTGPNSVGWRRSEIDQWIADLPRATTSACTGEPGEVE